MASAVMETAGKSIFSLPEWGPTVDAANAVDAASGRVKDLCRRMHQHIDEVEKRLDVQDSDPLRTTVYMASADLLVASARLDTAYESFKIICAQTLGKDVLDRILKNRFRK